MIKEAAQFSISHVLGTDTTNKEIFYKIPPYQREYTWGKDNWENLYNDIFEAEKGYFLGSIICIDEDIHNDNTVLQVIDGQQRLTTISILLAALYSAIQNLIDQDQSLELKLFKDKKLNINWLKIQSMLRLDDSTEDTCENRLTLAIQKNNQDDYIYLLDSVFKTNPAVKPKYFDLRGISKSYKYFLDKFEECDESGERINSLNSLFEQFEKICASIVVKISVDSMESAFVLFESINNRGVPLTPIDLIKNMIISNLVKNSKDANSINERWQTIVKNVESYDDQVRFLRHFYHAYKANSAIGLSKYTKATKTNIIRIYTTLIDKNSQYILDQLVDKSAVYTAIISPEKIDDIDRFSKYKDQLLNLKRVKSVPANSLILYLLTNFDKEDLVQILDYIETWFIRRHVTNYPTTNKLDQIFLEVIEKLQTKQITNLQEVITALNEQISKTSQKEFVDKLVTLPIYDENTDATRSLLIKLEKMERTKEEQVDFWQKNLSNGKLVWSLEHVLPQKPTDNSHWCKEISEDDRLQWLHTLGNLTLTCYNSNLSNSEYQVKCNAKEKGTERAIGLKSGVVKINQDFVELDNWDVTNIRDRGLRLANLFADLFN
ncbi:DUF262 domain-containing protein [Acinetobacter gandensis]|uniref:DUF262 domain-containing protein n=1 Tax=Acinetobacter gandensis TaxID=1443941 RepID=UPI003F548431